MNNDRQFDRLLEVLKRSYQQRGAFHTENSWDARMLQAVRDDRTFAVQAPESDSGTFFLRFSFAALALALLLHVSASFSPQDEFTALSRLVEFDSIDLVGDLDE